MGVGLTDGPVDDVVHIYIRRYPFLFAFYDRLQSESTRQLIRRPVDIPISSPCVDAPDCVSDVCMASPNDDAGHARVVIGLRRA
jgi:hypothetical protein